MSKRFLAMLTVLPVFVLTASPARAGACRKLYPHVLCATQVNETTLRLHLSASNSEVIEFTPSVNFADPLEAWTPPATFLPGTSFLSPFVVDPTTTPSFSWVLECTTLIVDTHTIAGVLPCPDPPSTALAKALQDCERVSASGPGGTAVASCGNHRAVLSGGGRCDVVGEGTTVEAGQISVSAPTGNGWRVQCAEGIATAVARCCPE